MAVGFIPLTMLDERLGLSLTHGAKPHGTQHPTRSWSPRRRRVDITLSLSVFFFNDAATTKIYTLSLHDALPIYGKPIVTAGFEPLDILQSVYMLLQQLAEGRCEVENQYARVVPWDGNTVALRAVAEVMELQIGRAHV